jgi:tyrosinase
MKQLRHRYDDWVAYHINATGTWPGTHNNGYFLPFHRYMLHQWENALQSECGYDGPTPWWDWSLESPERGGHFNSSPIWDPVLGFGGDGKEVKSEKELRCIEDGPWAKYNLTLAWPLKRKFERCLERDFDWALGEASASPNKTLNILLARDTYARFSELDFAPNGFDEAQGGPHIFGHIAVGGEV